MFVKHRICFYETEWIVPYQIQCTADTGEWHNYTIRVYHEVITLTEFNEPRLFNF